MFKRIAALAIVLVTMLCLTACSSLPPADEIIQNSTQAMDAIKTYQFRLDISMNMASGDEEYEQNITMGYYGTFDLENGEIMLDVSASMSALGESMEMSAEIYVIDGIAYVLNEGQGTDPEWERMEVPEEYWEELSQVEPMSDLLEMVQAEVVGSENVEGVDCYVLKLTPDLQQMLELTMQQSGAGAENMFTDVDEELLLEMFKNFSLKQWVAKDTYFLTKVEMDVSMVYPEDDTTTLEVSMNLLVHDYNQPVSIVLPEGAEEAIAAAASLGIVDEANSEAYDVDIAVLAAMIDNEVYELIAGCTVGPGYESSVYAADGVTELDIAPYLSSSLEAIYTLDVDGWVIAAVAEPGGKWDGLTYTEEDGWVE